MLRDSISSAAIGKWPGILSSLGVQKEFLDKKHGPCPVCGGKDRYRFDDLNGRGTWFCSKCGSGDGFSLLRNIFGWNFSEAAKKVEEVVGIVKPGIIKASKSDEDKKAILRKVWLESKIIQQNDPAWKYLTNRVGRFYPCNDLRLHTAMKHPDGGKFPALLAMMRYPDNSGASIHRTFITEDGHKAPVDKVKMFMPGLSLNTSCIRLSKSAIKMGIAEGIETALAAANLFDIPVWAATNAQLMSDWIPPGICKELVIFGDNDENYAGQAAAYSLAKRLNGHELTVNVKIPEKTGFDWCDILQASM